MFTEHVTKFLRQHEMLTSSDYHSFCGLRIVLVYNLFSLCMKHDVYGLRNRLGKMKPDEPKPTQNMCNSNIYCEFNGNHDCTKDYLNNLNP